MPGAGDTLPSLGQSCALDGIPNCIDIPTAPSYEGGVIWNEGLRRCNQVKRRSGRVLVPRD